MDCLDSGTVQCIQNPSDIFCELFFRLSSDPSATEHDWYNKVGGTSTIMKPRIVGGTSTEIKEADNC